MYGSALCDALSLWRPKGILHPLELGSKPLCVCWEPNPGPVLLTSKPVFVNLWVVITGKHISDDLWS